MELYTTQQLKTHPNNSVHQESVHTCNGTHIDIFHKESSIEKDCNSVQEHEIIYIKPSELIISSNTSIQNEASFIKDLAFNKSVYNYFKKKSFPPQNENQYSLLKSYLRNIIRKIMEILTCREIPKHDLIDTTDARKRRMRINLKFSIYVRTTTYIVQIYLKEEVLKFIITLRMEKKIWNIMRPYFNSLKILRWQILPDYSLISIPLSKCCLIRIPIELLPMDSNSTPLISERSRTKYINLKQFLSKISRYKSIRQIRHECQILEYSNRILTLNKNNFGSVPTKDEYLTFRKLKTNESDKKQLISPVEKANSEPLNSKQLSNNQTSSNICNQHFKDLILKESNVKNMDCSVIENKNVNANEFYLMAIKDKFITKENQDDHCQISNEKSTISENEDVKKELILIYSRDHKENRLSCFDGTMSSDIFTTGNEPLSSERVFDKISVLTSTSSECSVDFEQLIMSKKQNSEQTQTCTNMSDMSNDFNQISTKQLTYSNVYVDNRRLILNFSNSVQINIERLGRTDSDMALNTFWAGSEQSTSEMETSDEISSLEHCISDDFTDEEQFTEIPAEINALNNVIIISCMIILMLFLGLF